MLGILIRDFFQWMSFIFSNQNKTEKTSKSRFIFRRISSVWEEMEKPKYRVRQMKAEDFQEVLNICTEVDFTIAKHDLTIAYNMDPNGFFVAQNIDSGK